MTTLEGSTQFAELLAKNVRLEREKHTLSQALATAIRDRDRMALTLTDAQALASRQHDHIVALKAGYQIKEGRYDNERATICRILKSAGASECDFVADAVERVVRERAIARDVVTQVRQILGAGEKESAQEAARRVACENAMARAVVAVYRRILEAGETESNQATAERVVRERNDAVAGLAKVSAELENHKVSLAYVRDEVMKLETAIAQAKQILGATTVEGVCDVATRVAREWRMAWHKIQRLESAFREHHDEIEGRRGGG